MSYRQGMRDRRLIWAAVPLLAVLIAGCATAAPVAEPPAATPTTTPTAEPAPVPSVMVVGARGITVLDDAEAVLGELMYSEPGETAIEFLTAVFEAPAVITHRESDFNCVSAADVATWEGYFTLNYNIDGWTPGGQLTYASVIAPASPNGLALQTTSGFGVGDPVAAVLAGQPGVGADSMEFEGHTYDYVHYEVAEGMYLPASDPNFGLEPYWGALALGVDGVVTGLHSPVPYVDLC